MDVMPPQTDGCGSDVAPYVLGALTPAEARAFERHLAECELCRTDLATLQPVVDQLQRAVDPVDPPVALKGQIMAVVEAEAKERRRAERDARPSRFGFVRLRPLPAVAAACVLLLAGIGLTLAITQDEVRTVQATSSVPGARAQLRVNDGEGTLMVRGMPAAAKGRVYQVWVQKGDERPRPTDALFDVATDGRASVEVPGGVDGVSAVLVTSEPDGGSQVPSREPSVVAELS